MPSSPSFEDADEGKLAICATRPFGPNRRSAGEAELRIDLDDVRKLGEFLPRGFIERGRRRGRLRQAPAAGETSAALCGRSERVSWPHQHAIEKAGALQPTVDQLLQSDTEREHGH